MRSLALVTGATGFVGSHVAERLLESGFRVRLLVRDPRRLKWLQPEQFELLVGDMTESASLDAAVESADVVIHCAGLTKGLNEPDYMRANADATAMLARASEAAGVHRFVYCSSLAGCGPSRIDFPLSESDTPHPITPYGRSKLAGEIATQLELRNTEWIIIRPPAVMGPRDEQFIPLFKIMANWRFYTEVGMKRRQYSLIGVDDLARMLVHAATVTTGTRDTYFATMPKPFVWKAVADAFTHVTSKSTLRIVVPEFVSRAIGAFGNLQMKLTGKPVLLGSDKVTEILAESWACSGEKMARTWDMKCEDDLEAVVDKTYRFYRDQRWI